MLMYVIPLFQVPASSTQVPSSSDGPPRRRLFKTVKEEPDGDDQNDDADAFNYEGLGNEPQRRKRERNFKNSDDENSEKKVQVKRRKDGDQDENEDEIEDSVKGLDSLKAEFQKEDRKNRLRLFSD